MPDRAQSAVTGHQGQERESEAAQIIREADVRGDHERGRDHGMESMLD
ncbi:MAG TPA: hypothetical protein VN892_01335 [Solirubrobacteraceae bacterium]|nr:hypothetical protein [Solirubrobacteraceae bacterium]